MDEFGPCAYENSGSTAVAGNALMAQSGTIPSSSGPSDFEVLYNTLVGDAALPPGYLAEFMLLEELARRAATRAQNRITSISESSAGMELEKFQRQQGLKEQADAALADQLVMLSEIKPWKFRTRMQRLAYEKGLRLGETQKWTYEASICACSRTSSRTPKLPWAGCYARPAQLGINGSREKSEHAAVAHSRS